MVAEIDQVSLIGHHRDIECRAGPEGSKTIDPVKGAVQADINFEYKLSLSRATAFDRTERIISDMVVKSVDVSDEEADEIYQRELRKVSLKFTHMRYHSFLMYFGVLKRLGWVEITKETEASSMQDSYAKAPSRIYYRLTEKGKTASDDLWSNPLTTLYPSISLNHVKKTR